MGNTTPRKHAFNAEELKNCPSMLLQEVQVSYHPREIFSKKILKTGNFVDGHRKHLYQLLINIPCHKNVMSIYNWCEDADAFYTASQNFHGPDMLAFLKEGPVKKEKILKYLTKQMLLGLHHLHSHGIIHSDVKPTNIMFCHKRKKSLSFSKRYQVAWIDFDSSRIVCRKHKDDALVSPHRRLVGTPIYMSPEISYGHSPTPATDIWGVGFILYQLVTGRPPVDPTNIRSFEHARARFRIVQDKGLDFECQEFSKIPQAKSVCQQLLQLDMSNRPQSAVDALRSSWLWDNAIEEYKQTCEILEPTCSCAKNEEAATTQCCSPEQPT